MSTYENEVVVFSAGSRESSLDKNARKALPLSCKNIAAIDSLREFLLSKFNINSSEYSVSYAPNISGFSAGVERNRDHVCFRFDGHLLDKDGDNRHGAEIQHKLADELARVWKGANRPLVDFEVELKTILSEAYLESLKEVESDKAVKRITSNNSSASNVRIPVRQVAL